MHYPLVTFMLASVLLLGLLALMLYLLALAIGYEDRRKARERALAEGIDLAALWSKLRQHDAWGDTYWPFDRAELVALLTAVEAREQAAAPRSTNLEAEHSRRLLAISAAFTDKIRAEARRLDERMAAEREHHIKSLPDRSLVAPFVGEDRFSLVDDPPAPVTYADRFPELRETTLGGLPLPD